MQKRSLTKEKISEAAVGLIESEGLEGLSMRKLASKLQVEAASLYNHFSNKSELFDFIQEWLYSQMPTGFPTKNWKTHLSELAVSTRQGLLRTPNVVLLFATRPAITASSLKQAELTLNTLIKAGFKASDVLSIFRNLHVFVLGHVLAEVGQVPGETGHSDEPSLEAVEIDHYPTLKKAFSSKSSIDFDRGFKLGLEGMLNGFEILLARPKK